MASGLLLDDFNAIYHANIALKSSKIKMKLFLLNLIYLKYIGVGEWTKVLAHRQMQRPLVVRDTLGLVDEQRVLDEQLRRLRDLVLADIGRVVQTSHAAASVPRARVVRRGRLHTGTHQYGHLDYQRRFYGWYRYKRVGHRQTARFVRVRRRFRPCELDAVAGGGHVR